MTKTLRTKTAIAILHVLAIGMGDAQAAGILDPVGPVGEAQRTLMINALAIMLAIVVPTILATLAFAWWYRAGNPRARRRPDFVYSGRIELVTWSIPLLVILFLGGIAWVGSHDLEPSRPLPSDQKPLRVQVVSLDWKWLFILPDEGVASVNELVVPTGRPIALALTSASVMNTFFVPQLGSMIYTMNGMTNRLHLQADREGTFEGLSGHFSGDGFPGMRFKVRAVADAAFSEWVDGARRAGEALDRPAYDRLARQSSNVAPLTYRGVEAGLFDAIVDQTVPPSAGPDGGKPEPSVSPRSAALTLDGAWPFSGEAAICTPARPRGTPSTSAVGTARQGG